MRPEIDEVEEFLTRELRQVAEGLEVPALPALPEGEPSRPVWQPLLVAAAVLLVALGATATVVTLGGDDTTPQPAPAPTPTVATEDATATEPLSRTTPTVPHLLDDRLYVAGEQVPGEWLYVRGEASGWVALQQDGSWWWGSGTEPQRLEGVMDQPPAVSPDGAYEARIVREGGGGTLTGADTEPGGEGFGGVPVEPLQRGIASHVVGVTDDGLVVARGGDFQLLWRPLVDGATVDLAETAPGQMVVGSTEAGLVVVEGDDDTLDATQGEPYLADLSEDGTLTRTAAVPTHDDLVASSEWAAWIPPGTIGGEAAAPDELLVQRLDGSEAGTLTPPAGWSFRVFSWQWEDEDHLVATVDDGSEQRMVRCSPVSESCVLTRRP